jgi:hypothetical protein
MLGWSSELYLKLNPNGVTKAPGNVFSIQMRQSYDVQKEVSLDYQAEQNST